ncbi:hypothetical protein AUEXF2481DRAFT_25867 [Aureobasidium subglaciale EXF-2481]|uniref:Uncharacterized protein n=1 Tax=Aureobasidium subglaciale (strain EXF-2481) TaxID=1043005 RepID=A0A074YQE4_AURSE|nr:uncharacterized protein AUEXF2481DRAFT_25867 [Aureobasidium subglaciale EXF-2481]KEQ99993.1 hypothetical protein AUEXF2481DRAFT_25867 [Aureobasidium subglaciale EXF-2481]
MSTTYLDYEKIITPGKSTFPILKSPVQESRRLFADNVHEHNAHDTPPKHSLNQATSKVTLHRSTSRISRNSRNSLHPSTSRTCRDSQYRSDLRKSIHSHHRSASRDSIRSHHSQVSLQSHTSRSSFRSFNSRVSRNVDDRNLELRNSDEVDEIDGIKFWWSTLYLDDRKLGHFYCRQEPRLDTRNFFPGMIIRATHAYAQTDPNAMLGDRRIGLLTHGPVQAKLRPMVVLHSTISGPTCATMFSLTTQIDKFNWTNERQWECPLKERTYVNLSTQIHVSTREYVETDQGYLSPDQYHRLINLLDFYQEEREIIAYKQFGVDYKYRGIRLADQRDLGNHERLEDEVVKTRIHSLRPQRDSRWLIWSLRDKG